MDYEIILNETGEAGLLQTVPQTPRSPGAGEIRLRHEAIGVNFVDIYHRTGLYPLPSFPAVLGVEGAGVVEAVGSDVTDLKPGDRVAYAGLPVGAYASTRLLPAQRALLLPSTISSQSAAATMLRGLTTHMLLTNTFPVGPDTIMLVHAAAGGLGTLLTRWGKALGATVIGTVSSEDKAEWRAKTVPIMCSLDAIAISSQPPGVSRMDRAFTSPMTGSVVKLWPKRHNACARLELWRASVRPVEKSPRPSLMHSAIKQIFLSSGQA